MIKKRMLCNLTVLSFFLIAGGFLSVVLKYELLFDFLQYHYYNGFAFFNQRHLIDLGVAGVPTYYNPLLDTLIYLLVKQCGDNTTLYYFIQGLPLGLLLFVFWKICLIFFDPSTHKGKFLIALCLLIALTGFNVWFQIGTSSHDIPIAVLLLYSFYCLLQKNKKFFLAGFLLGSAAGLKLPSAIYCVSCGIFLILMYKKLPNPIKNISIFILGGFLGFMIFNGFWCWFLWKNFQNPFFPFWNAVFKSDWYPEINYVDRLHLNNLNLFRYIFLPFYLIAHSHTSKIAINADVSDIRFALLFTLTAGYLVSFLIYKKQLSEPVKTLSLLLFVSYVVWLIVSANMRFTIPIEMCGAILIVRYAAKIKKPVNLFAEALYWTALFLTGFLLLSSPYYSYYWGKRTHKTFLEEKILLPEKTLILSFNELSAGFVTQMIEDNPDAVAIGFYEHTQLDWKEWNISGYRKGTEKKQKMLNEHQNKVAFLVQSLYAEFLLPEGEQEKIKNWICTDLSPKNHIGKAIDAFNSRLKLCYPPEMKDKIIITK